MQRKRQVGDMGLHRRLRSDDVPRRWSGLTPLHTMLTPCLLHDHIFGQWLAIRNLVFDWLYLGIFARRALVLKIDM